MCTPSSMILLLPRMTFAPIKVFGATVAGVDVSNGLHTRYVPAEWVSWVRLRGLWPASRVLANLSVHDRRVSLRSFHQSRTNSPSLRSASLWQVRKYFKLCKQFHDDITGTRHIATLGNLNRCSILALCSVSSCSSSGVIVRARISSSRTISAAFCFILADRSRCQPRFFAYWVIALAVMPWGSAISRRVWARAVLNFDSVPRLLCQLRSLCCHLEFRHDYWFYRILAY